MILVQVLPQLIHYLGVDAEDPSSPDWGTLAVYTCSASCSAASDAEPYVEEFVWVQLG
jgi:pre-rRNA-processing protein TSR4